MRPAGAGSGQSPVVESTWKPWLGIATNYVRKRRPSSMTVALLAQFSVFPLRKPGNTGSSGNSEEIEGVARRARWNSRGTTGNRCQGASDTELECYAY